MNYLHLAQKRKSVRNYSNERIEQNLRNYIKKFLRINHNSPFSSDCCFQLVETRKSKGNEKIKIGTYGTVKGASDYIVGSVTKNGENSLIDYGYLFEKVVLEVTKIDLGTCILGLTFNKKQFLNRVSIPNNHWIPAVTPIGYINSSKGIKERIMRGIFKANTRKDFKDMFFLGNSHTPLEIADKLCIPFKMVKLAPSAKNDQPWRIIKSENSYHFYLCLKESLSSIKKTNPLNLIDMGIAMYHFEEGFKVIGCEGVWSKGCNNLDINEPMLKYISTFTPV